MGWNINLKTDKPMTESVVQGIIYTLPRSIRCGFGKQSWGWSLAVDVRLNEPNLLSLSGSYGLSGSIAEGAAESFARRLEKNGYHVEVGQME